MTGNFNFVKYLGGINDIHPNNVAVVPVLSY